MSLEWAWVHQGPRMDGAERRASLATLQQVLRFLRAHGCLTGEGSCCAHRGRLQEVVRRNH